MNEDNIQSLSEKELRTRVQIEITNLENRCSAVISEKERIKQAISDSQGIEKLTTKLIELDKQISTCLKQVSSIYEGFYGFQAKEETLKQIKIMQNLTSYLKAVKSANTKIVRHLKDHKIHLDEVQYFIKSSKKVLKYSSGFYKIWNHNPLNYIKGDTRLTGSRNIKMALQHELQSCGTYSRLLANELEITQKDFEFIEKSKIIVYHLGVQIKKNMDIWQKNPQIENISSIAKEVLSNLSILIKSLDHLSQDEMFIKVTDTKIINIQRSEENLLNGLLKIS